MTSRLKLLKKTLRKNNLCSILFYLPQLLLVKLDAMNKVYITPNFSAIYLRNGTSDIPVFREIFLEKEYDLKFDFDVEYIVDGGANIGVSSRYLLAKFPDAKIIAIEPEQQNFIALEKNIEGYENIVGLESGIWCKDCQLRIVKSEKYGEWGFQLQEANEGKDYCVHDPAIQCYSIDSIMSMFDLPRINILKLDIEGAEKEVFQGKNIEKWIRKCKAIIIELHDFLNPNISKIFFDCLDKYVFYEYYQSGENTVVRITGHK